MNTTFVEQDCKIEFRGKTYESGGAYILPCKDGKMRGVVYVDVKNRYITDWHGNRIALIYNWTDYQGNFCKMRRVSFDYNGHRFVGDYCPDWADMCKVRSTK